MMAKPRILDGIDFNQSADTSEKTKLVDAGGESAKMTKLNLFFWI